MNYHNNFDQFRNILGPQTVQDLGRFSAWYRYKVNPTMIKLFPMKTNADSQVTVARKLTQSGGDIYTLSENGNDYQIAISHLIVERPAQYYYPEESKDSKSSDSDKLSLKSRPDSLEFGQHDSELYFFHIKSSREEPCGLILIYPETRTALISAIETEYDCFSPLGLKKRGRLLIRTMIQYFIENSQRLGVNRLVLQDSSYFRCQSRLRPGLLNYNDLTLTERRQLAGLYPYYMQYGFKPIFDTALLKIESNLGWIKSHHVWDISDALRDLFLNYETKRYREYDFTGVQALLEQSINTDLPTFFDKFAVNYCDELSLVIDEIFDLLKLEKLDYNETYYVYHLDRIILSKVHQFLDSEKTID